MVPLEIISLAAVNFHLHINRGAGAFRYVAKVLPLLYSHP